jgi:uncharacterized protein (TIGR03435 family)
MRILLQVALAALSVLTAQAQVAPAADPCATTANRPAFDVVSIKPAQAAVNGWMRRSPDGLTFTGSLSTVIRYAYNLQKFQMSGGPDWLGTQDWEIRAKSDSPDADVSELSDVQRQALWDKHMQELQSMLAERFQFRCHMVEKEMPVYELVVAKGGSKLKESTAEASKRADVSIRVYGNAESAKGTAVAISRIALVLTGAAGRPVIDKTGLAGSYDFALDWETEPQNGTQAATDALAGASIYTAVEEQLGLKLQPAKSEVSVMIIDRAEKPAEN